MKEEKVNTMLGFRVTESFRNRIVLAAQKEGRTLQEVMTRAAKMYLDTSQKLSRNKLKGE